MNYPFIFWEERVHLFRPELPGKYLHYSKPIGDKFGQLEQVEESRYYTWSEVDAWIKAHDLGPIGEDEFDRLRKGILINPDEADAKRGIFRSTETAEEPPYNQDGKKPPEPPAHPGGSIGHYPEMVECAVCGAWVWPNYMPTHRKNYHPDSDV